ncbi:MAG: cardiolipin synthase [Planctomycetota bacterium]|nr:MAG: cardiolipin synthase [Planctomycetota bacterium]
MNILCSLIPQQEWTVTTILTHIGLTLGFILALVLISKIVRQGHRSPSSTIAWLLVIILAPWLGVPLYLMLGGRKMRRRAGRKRQLHLNRETIIPVAQAGVVDRILRNYSLPGATGCNSIQLCQTGQAGYAQLRDLIENARHSIYIETFVFGKDDVGRDIIQRLARRAGEGVEVRLLLDGLGSLHTRGRFLKPLSQAGGQWRHFNPVVHRPLKGRTDLRNHRKIAIADDEIVLAGGTNIAEEYIGPKPMKGRWWDLSFVLQGPAVGFYANIFRLDWEFASGETLRQPRKPAGQVATGQAVAQVVPSGPDIEGDCLYDALLSAIFQAKERLWIVTPYFIPDESLQQALLLACRRGVDVRVIVPRKSNHRLLDFARGPFLRQLQAGGIRIMQHRKMIHAKVLIMDNELAMVGSSNFDIRSLFLNYEVSMFVYSQAEISAIEEWVQHRLASCTKGVKPVGPIQDFRDGLARITAPLL